MKVLVIAAHPDDEVLGVGGTICRHVYKNDEVYVCIVTKPYEPIWSKEYIDMKIEVQKNVDKLLRIKKRIFIDFPTVKLNTIPHGELSKKISDVVDEVEPGIVYTNFEHDLNYDHSIVFRASLVATRPPKKIKLLTYEALSSTESSNIAFKPNVYVDISNYIEKKINAFKLYNSEIEEYPHPRSLKGIKNLAQYRGNEICVEFAEAFRLIRDIWT